MTEGGPGQLVRLAVRAPAACAEAVLGALLALAPDGLEQRDGESWVEYALYGTPAELPALPDGPTEIAGAPVDVSRGEVARDWDRRWRAFHRPQLVAERLHVRAPWHLPSRRAGVIDLVVDPGRAFGTGAHPTTRLCLELMLELSDGAGSLVDLGCGSGVLSIAARKLGFAPVVALDADEAAIEATRANARANGVTIDRVERFDLRRRAAPAADVVVANLMRGLLVTVAERLGGARPRALVASGLLDHEVDEVARSFEPLRERERRSEAGWSALLLTS